MSNKYWSVEIGINLDKVSFDRAFGMEDVLKRNVFKKYASASGTGFGFRDLSFDFRSEKVAFEKGRAAARFLRNKRISAKVVVQYWNGDDWVKPTTLKRIRYR